MPQAQQNNSQVIWSTGNTHRLLDLARAQKAVRPMRSAIYAAQQELAAEEQKHLQRIAELEAELAHAKEAPTNPAAGAPASEFGLTRERIAQIAATYFHQDDTELGDMKTAIRVALREAASTATGLPTAAPEESCPEAAQPQAKEALKAQAASTLDLTDEALTTIYKTANNEVGKARPLTTEAILKAMRAVAALATAHALGAKSQAAPTLDTIRFGGWCETHLDPKPCWHCQQVEKREVVAGATK